MKVELYAAEKLDIMLLIEKLGMIFLVTRQGLKYLKSYREQKYHNKYRINFPIFNYTLTMNAVGVYWFSFAKVFFVKVNAACRRMKAI